MSIKLLSPFTACYRIRDKLLITLHRIKMEHQIEDYSEVYQRLPWRITAGYSIGHVLNDVCASMWFTYLLVYFHYVLEFDNWQSGLLLLIGQIADGISTPFVGFFSDRSANVWICRYGKRKSWHLLGTICELLSFPFIFAPFLGDSEQPIVPSQLIYYSIFIIIFQFGWASVQISHLSLIPELTPNEDDRTRLTAIRYSFTVSSNLLVYVITWIVLQMEKGAKEKIDPSDVLRFQHIVWIIIVIGVLSSIIFHVIIREPSNGYSNDIRVAERTSVLTIMSNYQVYIVAVIYMSTRLFVNLNQVFVPLYLHETLDMRARSLALVPLVMFLGSLATSTVIDPLNRVLRRKFTYTLGAIIGIGGCIWIRFGDGDTYNGILIYFVATMLGSGGSIMLVSSIGVTTDLIGDKTETGAFIYGIMSFTDKLANGIAVIIIQNLHTDASNISYYRNILTYVCGGSAIVGTIFVWMLVTNRRWPRILGYQPVPNYNSINND